MKNKFLIHKFISNCDAQTTKYTYIQIFQRFRPPDRIIMSHHPYNVEKIIAIIAGRAFKVFVSQQVKAMFEYIYMY